MTNFAPSLSHDTQAILLLCGHFGPVIPAPLTLGEYNEVARWLAGSQRRPADLLAPNAYALLANFSARSPKLTQERLTHLLARGVAMGFALETWYQQGIWVVSRAEAAYPSLLRQRLGNAAPVLLYGIGDRDLMEIEGIGIVGSRDADTAALAFTRQAAEQCVSNGLTVISGGAKGVDQASAEAALNAGGKSIVILAEGVARLAVSKAYRQGLASGKLVLISHFHPSAKWTAGGAMARNKLIYALSQAALVVSSGLEGGTWEGAEENLRHGWVPLLVRSEANTPPGNRELLARGGQPIEKEQLDVLSERILQLKDSTMPKIILNTHSSKNGQTSLFVKSEQAPVSAATALVPDKMPTSSAKAPSKSILLAELSERGTSAPRKATDVFEIVWPYLEQEFTAEIAESKLPEVSARLALQPAQLRDWVRQAVQRGLVCKTNRPVRYQLAPPNTRPSVPS